MPPRSTHACMHAFVPSSTLRLLSTVRQLSTAFRLADQARPCMHVCMHLCPAPPCDSCQPCDSFPQLSTLLPRSTHACMHAFLPFSSLPPRSTLDSARYAAIASTVHLSHNCGQICDRNCDRNCDANFGPDQLDDKIHFKIISTFCVHGYAQEHTSTYI